MRVRHILRDNYSSWNRARLLSIEGDVTLIIIKGILPPSIELYV